MLWQALVDRLLALAAPFVLLLRAISRGMRSMLCVCLCTKIRSAHKLQDVMGSHDEDSPQLPDSPSVRTPWAEELGGG